MLNYNLVDLGDACGKTPDIFEMRDQLGLDEPVSLTDGLILPWNSGLVVPVGWNFTTSGYATFRVGLEAQGNLAPLIIQNPASVYVNFYFASGLCSVGPWFANPDGTVSVYLTGSSYDIFHIHVKVRTPYLSYTTPRVRHLNYYNFFTVNHPSS